MSDIALPNDRQIIAPAASQGTLVEQTRAAAEVAAAVSVAQQNPRNLAAAVESMKDLCSRLAVAQRAFYAVPNRGAGMSVHIARELARIYGNLDYGVRELSRDDIGGSSEMTVWAWDQETNVRSTRSFIQPHAQSLKGGGRKALTDINDVYLNNQNTGARAVRECIFTVLPGWFLADAEALLQETLERGDGKPLVQRQEESVAGFARIKVTQAAMEKRLGKKTGAWTPADMAELARIFTSITQDGIPATDFFPDDIVEIGELATKIDDSAPDPAELAAFQEKDAAK